MNRDPSGAMTFTTKKIYVYLALCVVLALIIGFGSGVGAAIIFLGAAPATREASSRPGTASDVPTTPQQMGLVQVATEGRPYQGPEDAAVTLVEFTDYECPFCAQYFQLTYPNLLAKYEGKLRYVIRNFPVNSIHPRAQKAAEAAECADDQGKFWEYHDILFQRQTALEVESLKRYAAELGLDAEAFDRCVDSGEKAAVVFRDLQDGLNYGVRGTPTFFINGRMLVGAQPLAVFESYIDAAQAAAEADPER
ncbi:MAG: thioredoxin domain-containing protein [Gemmatimonadales bacterium]|nr:thioredoxin domain-containing protein [Gemmatimonadales bacterium]NIN12555.1 thioredoxin domain-containing protein [Gemmatimonadales bacterium]NIR03550.1 thioredoxin domain-containing protein [Gemmatimonadales bacterium]NIS65872.1 thioredoxin domain-containing protein [Gemmatimonadales bacterium]